jgi:hypothetical protein
LAKTNQLNGLTSSIVEYVKNTSLALLFTELLRKQDYLAKVAISVVEYVTLKVSSKLNISATYVGLLFNSNIIMEL